MTPSLHKNNLSVAVTYTDASLQQFAYRLAQALSLPLMEERNSKCDFWLEFTPEHLQLIVANEPDFSPIYVDFLAGKSRHRYQYGGGKGQLLAKAIGLHRFKNPNVLDLTAGLGQDAFVLAGLGCSVQMLERSPVIAALLQDALIRARQEDWFAKLDLQLKVIDARQYLYQLSENFPGVIYMDPMFPEREKSALVKKEMRVLRRLLGDDEDAAEILNLALKKAERRVVVKRPRLAPALIDVKPDHVLTGKSGRFDVYLSDKK